MAELWKLLAKADSEALLSAIETAFEGEALAATLRVLDGGQQELELIFRAPPAPERLRVFGGAKISCLPLEPQDWLAAGAHATAPAPIGGFTLQSDRAPLHTGRQLALAGVHAFGDGHHATTRGCLAALDYLYKNGFRPQRVADIGCGSGVLAVGAGKLWPQTQIAASDLDPAALLETRAAIRLNGLQGQIGLMLAAGFNGQQGRYDLILMNIMAGSLAKLSAAAARHLKPGGYLVLSGLLAEQRGLVLQAYRAQRLALVRQLRQDGWMTVILRKRP